MNSQLLHGVLQLTGIVHCLAEDWDSKDVIASRYFDLSMVFGWEWHYGLPSKLAYFGIGDPLLYWFRAYLKCCFQCVKEIWCHHNGR